MIEIQRKCDGEALKLDAFWLRDHCRCTDCYNVETKQRKYNLLDIPATVGPIEMEYLQDDQLCQVKWSDGHTSVYNIERLHEMQVDRVIERSRKCAQRTCWNRKTILQNEPDLRVNLPELISSDEMVKKVIRSLIRYGIAFIDNVHPSTGMTELAIRRIFPIMKTLFGEMYTFTDVKDHADTAYSKEYLGAHTDNTYFCDAAGLQSLHCIAHVNGGGGESFFVDGLSAALELKRQNPHAFNILSTVQIPAEYIEEGEHHKHSAPMIRIEPITGEIIQLRLNVYDRADFDTIPQHKMSDFYKSFREYLKIVQSSENEWTFKLHPGTIVIFDNWRVYHGRYAYTGQRTMTGCYVQRTDYLSKARVLGIID